MISRRSLVATFPAVVAGISSLPVAHAAGSFESFLGGIREEALRSGVSRATLDQALRGIQPDQKVIELDRKQPEFTLTWAQYRTRVITQTRVASGQSVAMENQDLLAEIEKRFGVDRRAITGIWGLESNYGTRTGTYSVIRALATLAWDGRRAKFFRAELLAALRILESGDTTVAGMTGSYAGAMGQPQFMPTSFVRLAVDFDGDGRKDIWNSRADALASIANYLQKAGWRVGESWGQEVVLPANLPSSLVGRNVRRTLDQWFTMGVQLLGQPRPGSEVPSAILQPDGQGQPAYLVYANFHAIRRYNPSDFYALAVGLIGDEILGA